MILPWRRRGGGEEEERRGMRREALGEGGAHLHFPILYL